MCGLTRSAVVKDKEMSLLCLLSLSLTLIQVELNTTCPTVQPGACILLDESVYIQDSRETDSGTYSCVAENTAGTTTFEVQVMVEPPSSEWVEMLTVFNLLLRVSVFNLLLRVSLFNLLL